MKKTYLAIPLVFLMGVAVLTLSVSRSEHASAAPAAAATTTSPVTSEKTEALLLSCMDYRLTGFVTDYMQNERHLTNKYDYVILAGASLGVNNRTYKNWGETFWQHLKIALQIHPSIHKVMILDHRNCGAYKLLLGLDFPADANPDQLRKETKAHKKQLDKLAEAIHKRYPKLGVEILLMGLDGKVDELGL
jgi:hypothetical protein